MYAKIENNAVVEWPIASIQQLFPNTSFPSVISDDDMPDCYVIVHATQPPAIGVHQRHEQSTPVNVNGRWEQSWSVVDMMTEEKADVDNRKATQIRAERNNKLAACDWTQLQDAPLTLEQKAAWSVYRQALRDVSAQSGFPWTVNWPEAP